MYVRQETVRKSSLKRRVSSLNQNNLWLNNCRGIMTITNVAVRGVRAESSLATLSQLSEVFVVRRYRFLNLLINKQLRNKS